MDIEDTLLIQRLKNTMALSDKITIGNCYLIFYHNRIIAAEACVDFTNEESGMVEPYFLCLWELEKGLDTGDMYDPIEVLDLHNTDEYTILRDFGREFNLNDIENVKAEYPEYLV